MLPLPKTSVHGKIYATLEALGWSNWMPGPILDRDGRWVRQTGGEILHAHVYRNVEGRWCGLLPGSVLLRLATPPLHPGVVGSYPVWVVWFPSHLLLEGTSGI
jgi:hypothetical protein